MNRDELIDFIAEHLWTSFCPGADMKCPLVPYSAYRPSAQRLIVALEAAGLGIRERKPTEDMVKAMMWGALSHGDKTRTTLVCLDDGWTAGFDASPLAPKEGGRCLMSRPLTHIKPSPAR